LSALPSSTSNLSINEQ
jgi:hypothetical protein